MGLERPLLVGEGKPGRAGPTGSAQIHFLSWSLALQEVGLNGGSPSTSAFIFPISAGQTENLINCMKPK